MRVKALLLALLLGGRLEALGSSVTWLGGTLPFDTVPHLEADPKLLWGTGTGAARLGAALDVGLSDWWMVQGDWMKPLDGAPADAQVLSRLRLMRTDWRGLALAAFGGVELPEGAGAQAFVGVIGSLDLSSSNVVVNIVRRVPEEGLVLRVAAWAPYVAFALRPGIEYGWSSGALQGPSWLLPQLAVNLGGDLSIDLGVRFVDDSERSWTALTRLSFQLFPNP